MGDHDENQSGIQRDMDAINVLDTDITSPQKLWASKETSRDMPSAQSRMRKSSSTARSQEENKELVGHKNNPREGNDEEAVHGRKIKAQNQTELLSEYYITVEERFGYLENEVKFLKAALESSARGSAQGEKSIHSEQRPASRKNAGISNPEQMGVKRLSQEQRPAYVGNAPEILGIKYLGETEFYQEHPHVLQVMFGNISSPRRSNMQNTIFEKSVLPRTVPLRLRIRSRPLLRILERMTDYTLLQHEEQQSLVFRYPYKPIIALEHRIRNLFRQMSTQYILEEPKNTGKPSTASRRRFFGSAQTVIKDDIIGTSHKNIESVKDSNAFTVLKSDENPWWGDWTRYISNEDPVLTMTEFSVLLEHLHLLIKFFDNELRLKMELCRQVNEGSLTHVAFADLWYLFNLGQEVLSYDEPGQVFRVISYNHAPLSTDSGVENLSETRVLRFTVSCAYFDFDGDQYGPIKKIFTIREYEGTKPVMDLPIAPLVCHPDNDTVRKMTIERGNEFYNLTSQRPAAHRMYSGFTLDTPQREVESDIIIDFRMAHLEGFPHIPKLGTDESVRDSTPGTTKPLQSHCSCPVCVTNPLNGFEEFSGLEDEARFLQSNKDLLQAKTNIKPNDYTWTLLLPKRLIAFILRNRTWAMLDIGSVSQIIQTDAFRLLVLPEGCRKLLEALVKVHGQRPATEISTGLFRRQGLILLLHGVPGNNFLKGVGKSSTAEAVAAAAGRPFFAITPAEVGSTVVEVEKNLIRHFHLAETWDCVLLLDEADVYLASRTKSDLVRNALVSVFLRTLEYFSGILFLTTNRVGNIDEAFKSRIHVSLYYPALDHHATRKVWKMYLNSVVEQSRLPVDVDGILAYAHKLYKTQKKKSHVWNGRQIRNAVLTAVALAQSTSASEPTAELKVEHIVSVADASNQFEEYLTDVFGGITNSDLAHMERFRSDDFRADSREARSDPKQTKIYSDDRISKGKRGDRTLSAQVSKLMALDDLSDDDSESDSPRMPTRTRKGKEGSEDSSSPGFQ